MRARIKELELVQGADSEPDPSVREECFPPKQSFLGATSCGGILKAEYEQVAWAKLWADCRKKADVITPEMKPS